MARAQWNTRGRHLSATVIWRIILAVCLCLCALTALYYEATAVVPGKNALQDQLVADEEFTLRTHMLRASAVLRTPCDYGVAQEDRNRFCCSGDFDCGGSESKHIPCWQVNDDFCDCLSGRDEPGTSACSQQGARFLCGDGKVDIPTSFLQDGIRDCADGSDEVSLTRGFRSHVT
ncbi:g2744 [Coccomyxa viridis]|uniref:G2744 protein n=1 Tax=Coccomyxa viridis TaxID=1274662 RepID=A0ABP1FRC0_9CHLO